VEIAFTGGLPLEKQTLLSRPIVWICPSASRAKLGHLSGPPDKIQELSDFLAKSIEQELKQWLRCILNELMYPGRDVAYNISTKPK
jgi:hypothetical protein